MKRILLTPYPGVVHVTRNLSDYQRVHKRLTGRADGSMHESMVGRMTPLERKGCARQYLVLARNECGRGASTLAHELSHVVFNLFELVGIDPAACQGEPFCYMLGHLIDEARK